MARRAQRTSGRADNKLDKIKGKTENALSQECKRRESRAARGMPGNSEQATSGKCLAGWLNLQLNLNLRAIKPQGEFHGGIHGLVPFSEREWRIVARDQAR